MHISYKELLAKAEREFDSFSLVWRDGLKFNSTSKQIEQDLRPYLISEVTTDEWPGTKLFKAKAIVRTYSVNPESVKVLGRVKNVFDWISPGYPEDLAFYKKSNVVFASIAHEKDAWFT